VLKIIVSVKGGGNIKADDIRSLMAVREREKADIGIFISLETPTKGMIADAATAGFYQRENHLKKGEFIGQKYPRIQLLTIEGLLNQTQRALHPDVEPDLNFKKAKAESSSQQKELL
jgi:site-specific DNA-methyltransferase (adenine-specific)